MNRGGWSSGNAIALFWEDFEDRSTLDGAPGTGALRTLWHYDAAAADAAKLNITYEAAVGQVILFS